MFTWFYALAVLFQLARGDMGLFPALRSTPDGTTFGDGPTAQLWFVCALVALAVPRVWSLLLLSAAGAFDFFWRLPVVPPSMFFNGLVTLQVLVTALDLLVRRRTLRIQPGELIERLRPGLMALLAVLFFFAVFHKFTSTSIDWSAAFFHLMAVYYAPFAPTWWLPNWFYWLLTVGGEGAIFLAFAIPRLRTFAVLVLVAFAAFVGVLVYGFGSILLASAIGLAPIGPLFEPLERNRFTRRVIEAARTPGGRIAFAITLAAIFMLDHWTGFTLADRRWLFPPDQQPGTWDVLTPMQIVWFVISWTVVACAVLATWRRSDAIASTARFARSFAAWAIPALLIVSELGLYVGAKEAPNIAMFSGLTIISRHPNHFVVRSHLLTSVFHRDLLFVASPWGEGRIGTPILSLKSRLHHAMRLGVGDDVIEAYRDGVVTRLRDGVEEPFDFESLYDVVGSDPYEVMLPQQLFLSNPVPEADLRAAMPELFVTH